MLRAERSVLLAPRPDFITKTPNHSYATMNASVDKTEDEIVPHLFLGNAVAGENALEDLVSNKRNIAIVRCLPRNHNVLTDEMRTRLSEVPNIEDAFLEVEFGDNPKLGTLQNKHMEDAYHFIDNALANGKKVLVHCAAGASRSPSIVISYLMRKYDLEFKDAYNHVRNKRPIVNVNNFQATLNNFRLSNHFINRVNQLTPKFGNSVLGNQKRAIWQDFLSFYQTNGTNPQLAPRSLLLLRWAENYMARNNNNNPFTLLNQQRRTGILSIFNPSVTASMQLFREFIAEDWKGIPVNEHKQCGVLVSDDLQRLTRGQPTLQMEAIQGSQARV